MFCELYYIPFYFESVKDYGPIITGVALIPLTATLIPTSVIVGRLMTILGHYRWAIWLGWATTVVSSGLLILLNGEIRVYAWVLVLIVAGLGHGLVLMSLNVAVQAMADTHNVAYAVTMYTFMRTFGMCIGVAVGGAVFQNGLKKRLGELNLPASVANDAERFIATLRTIPKASIRYQTYILAYADSFKLVFQVLTAIAGLAAILSLFIKEHTMDKELNSEHVLHQQMVVHDPEVRMDTKQSQ